MCIITPSVQIKHIYRVKRVTSVKYCLFPWRMLTPALLNKSLISNYTMKNCIACFWISKPPMCWKVWRWSSPTYLKPPLHKKRVTLKTGVKLNMQIGSRPKQYVRWHKTLAPSTIWALITERLNGSLGLCTAFLWNKVNGFVLQKHVGLSNVDSLSHCVTQWWI